MTRATFFKHFDLLAGQSRTLGAHLLDSTLHHLLAS